MEHTHVPQEIVKRAKMDYWCCAGTFSLWKMISAKVLQIKIILVSRAWDADGWRAFWPNLCRHLSIQFISAVIFILLNSLSSSLWEAAFLSLVFLLLIESAKALHAHLCCDGNNHFITTPFVNPNTNSSMDLKQQHGKSVKSEILTWLQKSTLRKNSNNKKFCKISFDEGWVVEGSCKSGVCIRNITRLRVYQIQRFTACLAVLPSESHKSIWLMWGCRGDWYSQWRRERRKKKSLKYSRGI